jgi:hypothetical protein
MASDHIWNVLTALAATAGVLVVILQLRQMTRALRADAYMKLAADWRSEALHNQVVYILDLWAGWKKAWEESNNSGNPDEWAKYIEQCASKWVEGHEPNARETVGEAQRRQLQKEWDSRRSVSQFLAKLEPMIANGFFQAEDVFGVVPEMGRLLAVLNPIERKVQTTIEERSEERDYCGPPVTAFDLPFPKWEFEELWDMYLDWFNVPRWRTRIIRRVGRFFDFKKFLRWFMWAGKQYVTLNGINWQDPRVGLTVPSPRRSKTS